MVAITLPFFGRVVSGAVGALVWLFKFRLDGVEGGDLMEGGKPLDEIGRPGDVFEPARRLEGIEGCEEGWGLGVNKFEMFISSQKKKRTICSKKNLSDYYLDAS
jgi:hypothetical protein